MTNIPNYNNFTSPIIPDEQVIVIADDITGAAEIAGVCLRYGIDVSLGIDRLPETDATIQIIATDSRSLTEAEAYSIHKRVIESILKEKTDSIIFKKCDSALRGYILTELKAIMEYTGKNTVLLQPANPKAERYILNGNYIINDQLIEDTGFAYDPDFPALTSQVRTLLLSRSKSFLSTKNLFSGEIKKLTKAGIYIPNCASVTDLAKSLNIHNSKNILCGSAAFFEQFLLRKGYETQNLKKTKFRIKEKFLLVSGSSHSSSKQFRSELSLSCSVIPLPESLLLPTENEKELALFSEKISQIYTERSKLCLTISDKNIQFSNSSTILKRKISLLVKELILQSKIHELFIEGGATAFDILLTTGFNAFTPIAELAPGVVRMQSLQNTNLYLTLKPGSYPWPEKLFY